MNYLFRLFGSVMSRKRKPPQESEMGSPPKRKRRKLPLRIFKVIVIGDSGTGKTALVNRYVANEFGNYMGTRGFHLFTKEFEDEDGKIIINIFDISGKECLSILSRPYIVDCTGAMVVVDATNPKDFPKVSEWVSILREVLEISDLEEFPCILLLNKYDIANLLGATDYVLRTLFSWGNDITKIFRTSAKTDMNVKDAFEYLIEEMKKRWLEEEVLTDARLDPAVARNKTRVRKLLW